MDMSDITNEILRYIHESDPIDLLIRTVSALLMVVLIIVLFNLIQFFTGKVLKNKISPQRTFVIQKTIKYVGFIAALLFIFRSMGIDASAILGAAGIVGIVAGFAAQTSVSNFISGLFLLSEKPFHVGDSIKLDGIMGVVMSVDLMSVKIHTFDNLYVRIPNETIIKANLITLSRFPIRRLDLIFNVSYQADLENVQKTLQDIAEKNIHTLDNPAPIFRVDEFNKFGVMIIFNVWTNSNNVLGTKTSMYMDIRKRFTEENIELSYEKVELIKSNPISEPYESYEKQ
jgi:small-conductance mechanosensitive channel